MDDKSINTALILAGGLGTRLSSVVSDRPKPMAEINGKPFLDYIIEYLLHYKIENIIICAGHKHPRITEYYKNNFSDKVNIDFSIEDEPLGTGGAVNLAIFNFNISQDFLLLNGDSIFYIPLDELVKLHKEQNSELTISLKQMNRPYRYGTVELDKNNKVVTFNEKKEIESGVINCGVYACKTSILSDFGVGEKFSFEKNIMEVKPENNLFYGFISDSYFIDIGLPESYERAQKDLPDGLSNFL